jgi:hypothetical protein
MPEVSTTPVDNPDDAANATPPAPDSGTDNQPAPTGDNLDGSKPTDGSDGGDKTPPEKKDDTPVSTFDDDIDDWIKKRNLPVPTDDAQKQEYQNLRNEQREFTRERQAKKDAGVLGDVIADTKKDILTDDDEDDETEKRLNKLEADRVAERETRLQSEFYTTNKVSDTEHKAILDIYREKTSRATTPEAKKAAVELWSSPDMLPDLLDLARAKIAKTTDNSAVADEAARKERERIARESEANSPRGAASTTSTQDKTADQAAIDRWKTRYNK